jgi:hypothetical protein
MPNALNQASIGTTKLAPMEYTVLQAKDGKAGRSMWPMNSEIMITFSGSM